MNLVTLKEILRDTRKNHFAVGGFNFNSFEDAQGMVDGASELHSPIILMASVGAVRHMGIQQCVGMVKGMAEATDIPVCLHLDHATDYELICACVDAGFSSVMVDASKENLQKNIQLTRAVVEYASPRGCSVEAELGRIGGREENIMVTGSAAAFTDPGNVSEFVTRTGIGALAVAIGTAHGFYKEKPRLDFPRLEQIVSLTECPLVLHGGTGVPEEDFRAAIRIGISKINVGTELKAAFVKAIRDAVVKSPEQSDPRLYMNVVRTASAERVKAKIRVFGCAGKG